MAISIDDVLNATQYRSMSRAGKMTETLSSKTRGQVYSKIVRRREESGAAPRHEIGSEVLNAGMQSPSKGAPLRLLSVAELADTDAERIAADVQHSLPEEFIDPRADPLCSSGRDHPDVKVKGDMIITLEKEIAFHKALEPFHGGVDTAASRQSAEVAARARAERDRLEDVRRAEALATVAARDPKRAATSFGRRSKRDVFRASTPSIIKPLGNPTAANQHTPSFVANTNRFVVERMGSPAVGHYRPRFGVVETASKQIAFSKSQRPPLSSKPAYIGDQKVIPSPGKELSLTETPPKLPLAGVNPRSPRLLDASTSQPSSPSSPMGQLQRQQRLGRSRSLTESGKGHITSPIASRGVFSDLTASQEQGSRVFLSPGRSSPVMTRGQRNMFPVIDSAEKKRRHRESSESKRDPRATSPVLVNDAAYRPTGPKAFVDIGKTPGREAPVARSGTTAAPDVTYASGRSLPLRNGEALVRASTTVEFNKQSTREQRQRASGERPEDQAQLSYNLSGMEKTSRMKRQPVASIGKTPGRDEDRRYLKGRTGPMAESVQTVSGGVPEGPAAHIPTVRFDTVLPRPSPAIHQNDLVYAVNESPVRSAAPAVGISPAKTTVARPTPAKPRETLPPVSSPEGVSGDSALVRRKLTQDVVFRAQVTRDQQARAGRSGRDTLAPDVDTTRVEQAQKYLEPHQRGDPRLSSHMSRAQREALAARQQITATIPLASPDMDPPNLTNMRTGYVDFSRATERDKHAGNHFANERRTMTRLTEATPKQRST